MAAGTPYVGSNLSLAYDLAAGTSWTSAADVVDIKDTATAKMVMVDVSLLSATTKSKRPAGSADLGEAKITCLFDPNSTLYTDVSGALTNKTKTNWQLTCAAETPETFLGYVSEVSRPAGRDNFLVFDFTITKTAA